MVSDKIIIARIIAAAKRHKISIRKLAEHAGMNPQRLYSINHGKCVLRIGEAAALAHALAQPLESFLKEEDSDEANIEGAAERITS